jgi:hypothetical protein
MANVRPVNPLPLKKFGYHMRLRFPPLFLSVAGLRIPGVTGLSLIGLLLCVSCNHSDRQAAQAPMPAPTDQPLKEGTYSASFGRSLDEALGAYYNMVNAFVNWDSAAADLQAKDLGVKMDSLKFDDFSRDTLVYQTAIQQLGSTRAELTGLLGEKTLSGKRKELNMVSQDLYDFLRTIRYHSHKIYFTECPMAFGEDNPGDWVGTTSDSARILNPYLGNKHPQFGAEMVHCSQIKDSLPGQ